MASTDSTGEASLHRTVVESQVEVGGPADQGSPQGDQANQGSPSGAPANQGSPSGAPANRRASEAGQSNRSNSKADQRNHPSPVKATDSPRKTPRSYERSDTSFASVDISDITDLDEGKNRTPTPQPTFEDRPQTAKVRDSLAITHDAQNVCSTAQVPVLKIKSAWTECQNADEVQDRHLPADARLSPESDRSSPVIKKLQPAYLEIPEIVPTNYSHSTYTYLLRSKSVPEISLTSAPSDNPDPSPSDRDLTSPPENCRGRTRKRRSIPTGQDLSLAQKVLLARRVESYITSHQAEQRDERETYTEKTTARDVHVEMDDERVEKEVKSERRRDVRSHSSAVESTAVTAATVATATRSHSSQETRRHEEMTQEEKSSKEEYKEDVKVKDTEKEKYEHHDVRKEEHKESVKDTSDVRQDRKESYKEEASDVAVASTAAAVAASSASRSNTEEQSTSSKTESDKRSSSRTSTRSNKSQDRSIVDEAKESVAQAQTSESSRNSEVPSVEKEEGPVVKAAAAAAAAAPSGSKPGSAGKRGGRPESAARKARNKEEDDDTIAALDKLADRNLNSLLGKDDGKGDDSEIDQKVLDRVFNPKFQEELDNFLRTT